MSLNKIIGSHAHQAASSEQRLREGQILQGKILKIYPDNKAQIMLNGRQMVAQLKASIEVEGKYLFQVESTGEMIHLKVIGEEHTKRGADNFEHLLSRFGLHPSRKQTELLQRLLKEGIPFTGPQIKSAARLMSQGRSNLNEQQILVDMIAKKLPVTENVFQALSVSKNGQLSPLLVEIRALAAADTKDSNDLPARLLRLVEPMLSGSTSEGEIPLQNRISTEKWASALSELMHKYQLVEPSGPFPSDREGARSSSIQRVMDSMSVPAVLKLMENKGELVRIVSERTDQVRSATPSSMSVPAPVLQQEFSSLKLQIQRQILPLLSIQHQQNVGKLLEEGPSSLPRLHQFLEILGDESSYRQLETMVHMMKNDMNRLPVSPKENFMQHLAHFLRFFGIDHEQQIASGNKDPDLDTIKSILIKMVQQGEGDKPTAQQLLHLINGMQLNSVSETASILQASLLLPGARFGLRKDMKLEFESRRLEDGKIDPDHCRILFYLDLSKIKETVIDMQVQKRFVSLIVYNDFPEFEKILKKFQPVLKQGLQSQEYMLSGLVQKPLNTRSKSRPMDSQVNKSKTANQDIGGVDYRI